MQYSIDSGLAKKLVDKGFGVTKLRNTKIDEIAEITGIENARKIKKAITRQPIPRETLLRLVDESDWSCCLCFNVDQRRHVIIHHIVPYEKTQDHSYENLVVLCLEHHAHVHSKSDLTGDLLPAPLVRQKKQDFINAVKLAKEGKRAWPGREPFQEYSWGELLRNSQHQVKTALGRFANIYDADLYVNREFEQTYTKFIESDKTGLLIVDKSGQGKTNLVCHLASELIAGKKFALLIRGDTNLIDENGLEKQLCQNLGYDPANFQYHLRSVAQTLEQQDEVCFIFIDGISENSNLQALSSLLANLTQLGRFKLCVTMRDLAWNRVSYDLPQESLYLAHIEEREYAPQDLNRKSSEDEDEKRGRPRHLLSEMTDDELAACLLLYTQKFDVDFIPSAIAKKQLKHPLMLRMFFEAYQGKTLGNVSDIPVDKTFDLYLTRKTEAIERRTQYEFRSSFLLRILRLIAFAMWQLDGVRSLDETQWQKILSQLATANIEMLVDVLANEGMIEIEENKVTLERTLRIVFDQLQEYLLLQHLLTLFPESVIQSFVEKEDFKVLLSQIKKSSPNINYQKLLSLIGMRLSDLKKRRYFLQDLMRYDFHTFCACLAHIPPVGTLSNCNLEDQKSFATELLRWYKLISTEVFPIIFEEFDPWIINAKNTRVVGIDMSISPECKEISYHYEPFEKNVSSGKLIKVKGTTRYPTWSVSIVYGDQELSLHDPENGIIIPTFRRDPNNRVTRTLNYKYFPRFPGGSFNVPERMALHDIWDEVSNLINQDQLTYLAPDLIAEQVWSIAVEIIEPDKIEGLDFEKLQVQKNEILSAHSESVSVRTLRNLENLGTLLRLLDQPLQIDDSPYFSFLSNFNEPIKAEEIEDDRLEKFLANVVWGALQSYLLLIESNFSNLSLYLNTYVNFPSSVLVITDRVNVRIFLLPVAESEDANLRAKVTSEINLTNPEVKLIVNLDDEDPKSEPMNFEAASLKLLKDFKKSRLGIHPVDDLIPIDKFFNKTPMNNLVKRWLLRDLRALFSL